MPRWKELPAELDARARHLVVRLRRLKDHSGLSMAQLASRTGYSAKSWERYLNGRSLPPVEAVSALARIGGEDPVRLLALHELAAEGWATGRPGGHPVPAPHLVPGPAPVPAPPPAPAPSPAPASPPAREPASSPEPTAGTAAATASAWREPLRGRHPRVVLLLGVVPALAVVASVLLLAVRLTDSSGGDGKAAAPAAEATAAASWAVAEYTCRPERIDGLTYAGNSRTMVTVVAYGHAGPEVAEAQCLLREAGLDPGDLDGIFGPLTQRAVQRAQRRAELPADGIVGPHTWKALRSMARG
ncbi:peptidoglycan-binding protein [Streptomyces sp. MJP52]|uniref:peptidoglycan-binding protein n=1 Tax=Streptomyces sp. MJP52 TaxID=2940555 RepID=UPI0024750589|nr:peptidoglycan-binding protein [Streptomyces sp. MJP52]MDH6228773.1 hypothetical protein [Streptomyces sp. MJP52]